MPSRATAHSRCSVKNCGLADNWTSPEVPPVIGKHREGTGLWRSCARSGFHAVGTMPAGLPPSCLPSPGRTCHDVLHHGYEVGRLAEGGRVVVLILEQKRDTLQEPGRHSGLVGIAGWHRGALASMYNQSQVGCHRVARWPPSWATVQGGRIGFGETCGVRKGQ